MSTIVLDSVRIFAHHGVIPVEQKVGQWYEISLKIETDTSSAEQKDELSGTVDYSELNDIIHFEMSINSKLIENVGYRITQSIKKRFPQINSGVVVLSKLNPPVKGLVNNVTIELSF